MKKYELKLEYAPVTQFTQAAYNPRTSTELRLNLLHRSIDTMGFIMPIYVDENDTILSGHQRLKMAVEIDGIKEVPFIRLNGLSDHDKKMFNIMFNAATNDFYENETNENIVEKISLSDFDKIDVKRVEKLELEYMTADELIDAGVEATSKGGGAIIGLLNGGITIPLVLAGNKIVNGNGRFMAYRKRMEKIPVVRIPEPMADLAKNALNRISMEFSVNDDIRPFLRYSAYRRARQTREQTGLGTNFKWWCKHKSGTDISTAFQQKFQSIHGKTIINFGAGNLSEEKYLDQLGVKHLSFEPYICTDGEDSIDIALSKKVCSDFLDNFKKEKQIDSVFLNFILNSIGTEGDMHKVLMLIGLFDTGSTRYWISAKSKRHPMFLMASGKRQQFNGTSNNAFMISESETISTAEGKVQRFFEPSEYSTLLKRYFGKVKVALDGVVLYAYCSEPKKFTQEDYESAIDMEFGLDYPDGSRMDLETKAKEVLLSNETPLKK